MSTHYRARAEVIHTRLPRGMVLLDPVTKAYFELNGSGEFLWTLLAAPCTSATLVDRLRAEFLVAPDVATRDVSAWLDELLGLGLITSA
jgi:hypothetical protein